MRRLGRYTICISLLFLLVICLTIIPHFESESYSVSWTSPNTYSWGVELNATISVGFNGYPSVVELYLSPEGAVANQTTELRDNNRTDYFYLEESLQHLTYYTATLVFGEENNTRSFTWNFTTCDQGIPNPPIEMPYGPHNYFPEPCSSDVPLDTAISISFARPPGNVELRMSPEAAVKERTFEAVDRYGGIYTFHLSESLEPSTTYNVTMLFSSGDATWGIARGTRTWNFTTIAEATEPNEQTG